VLSRGPDPVVFKQLTVLAEAKDGCILSAGEHLAKGHEGEDQQQEKRYCMRCCSLCV